jgi:hypothetical protein
MRLESPDSKMWLEVRRWTDPDHDYSAFEVESFIDIGHGAFSGVNRDIHWSNLAQFVEHLEAFTLSQQESAELKGTYDTFIRVRHENEIIAVDFCIGDAYCGGPYCEFRVSGTFAVSYKHLCGILPVLRQWANLPQ